MPKTKILLTVGAGIVAVGSFAWLGTPWTVGALEFAFVTALLTYLSWAWSPFGQRQAEGLLLSCGSSRRKEIMQHLRRYHGLMPFTSVFAVMLLATVVGLLTRLLGSEIIAVAAVAAVFFLCMLVIGVVWAVRPPKDFSR